jgi:glycosyltransferase involved in cell wall biosynthesis
VTNVLLVMTARQTGGAELYVERLARALGDRCRFTIAASGAPEMALLRERLGGLGNVAALHTFPFDNPRAILPVLRQLRTLARKHDVVHLNSNHPASRLGILVGFALRDLPWIAVEQRATPVNDVVVPRTLVPVLPALYRWSRRSASTVVAVSRENAETLARIYKVPRSKIVVVYNGADLSQATDRAIARTALRAELKLRPEARLVLVLARLLPNKGHRFLVDAAPTIIARHPDVHFVFAGALDDPAPVRARIEELGLSARFSLLGFRTDTVDLLAASDVTVLPSLAEGFALTILEALAAGLPVVATAVGGATEILEDGVNGFLVPPADAPALANAVGRALALDAPRRASLQEAALASAGRFSIEETARQMLEIYRAARQRDP